MAVIGVGGILLLLILLLLWRGDRAGLQVSQMLPASGADAVSVRSAIRLTFAEAVSAGQTVDLSLDPPAAGQVRWEGASLVFQPDQPLAADTDYVVTVAPGVMSRQGRVLQTAVSWRFRTGRPRILFINWDDSGAEQLFSIDDDGGDVRQLTNTSLGLLDYGINPAGDEIVYAARRADDATDLWLVNAASGVDRLLLDCLNVVPAAACSGPVWLPGSRRLIYERRNILSAGSPPGAPRLYWLDVDSGATAPVFADSQWLGLGARFSPDGSWLSYVAPGDMGIRVYNLVDGRDIFIPTPTGQPAWWHPNRPEIILTDMQLLPAGFAMHMFQVDLVANTFVDLSGEQDVEDGPPAYSPDGSQIVFGRKAPRTPMGKQIWLYDLTTGETTKLTNDADVHHGVLSWSPGGDRILLQRYAITEPGARPGIWLLELASGEMSQIAAVGTQPAWLP